MTVITWDDELFDILKKRLPESNITFEAGRTTIGLTNNFKPVSRKLNNESSINVFRAKDACRTESPCDVQRVVKPGDKELILCQCFPEGEDSDSFGHSFVNLLITLEWHEKGNFKGPWSYYW